jgi:hypothetical protein
VWSGRPRPLVCKIDELEAGEGARPHKLEKRSFNDDQLMTINDNH